MDFLKQLERASSFYNLSDEQRKLLENELRLYLPEIKSFTSQASGNVIPFVLIVPRLGIEDHLKLIQLGSDPSMNTGFLRGNFRSSLVCNVNPYLLINIDIREHNETATESRQLQGVNGKQGPLTLIEAFSLVTQYPQVLKDEIRGIHACGTKFDPVTPALVEPSLETHMFHLHIYRLGEKENAYLKMAREKNFFNDSDWISPTGWRKNEK